MPVMCSDLHLRYSVPSCRGETQKEWLDHQSERLLELITFANNANADIFIAGDIFHDPKPSMNMGLIASMFIDIMSLADMYVFIMPGNHDKENHADLSRNTYGILDRVVKLDGSLQNISSKYDCIPFGDEPVLNKKNGSLFLHTLTFENEDDVPYGVTEFETAKSLVKKYPEYSYIIVGDMHRSFVKKIGNTTVINCGCMTPQATPEFKYDCGFVYIDPFGGVHSQKYQTPYIVKEDILGTVEGGKGLLDLSSLVSLSKDMDAKDMDALDYKLIAQTGLTKKMFSTKMKELVNIWMVEGVSNGK